jgi:hypothetical protein
MRIELDSFPIVGAIINYIFIILFLCLPSFLLSGNPILFRRNSSTLGGKQLLVKVAFMGQVNNELPFFFPVPYSL